MIILTIIFLALMEIALSFDNAIINASVLRNMSLIWQRRFITWGMPIAVIGMRLLFPLLIVCIAAGTSVQETINLAIQAPAEYAEKLATSKNYLNAFGGIFLLMVFLKFLFQEKEIFWISSIEKRLSQLGKIESVEILFALFVLVILHGDAKLLLAGLFGIMLYILIGFFTGDNLEHKSGIGRFLYLEALDASCSFDGVIGAFVLTDNIFYIMLGLGIGALCIRSLTITLVRGKRLSEYVYLEHGAHYAIGALAVIMLVDIAYPIPEAITGLTGIILIGLSLLSSIRKGTNHVTN